MADRKTRYYLHVSDIGRARGSEAALAFDLQSPQSLANALQSALRDRALFERWRRMQDEPDEVDASLGATDPAATVTASNSAPRVDLVATTTLPHALLKHRLNMLIGPTWTLGDVRTV